MLFFQLFPEGDKAVPALGDVFNLHPRLLHHVVTVDHDHRPGVVGHTVDIAVVALRQADHRRIKLPALAIDAERWGAQVVQATGVGKAAEFDGADAENIGGTLADGQRGRQLLMAVGEAAFDRLHLDVRMCRLKVFNHLVDVIIRQIVGEGNAGVGAGGNGQGQQHGQCGPGDPMVSTQAEMSHDNPDAVQSMWCVFFHHGTRVPLKLTYYRVSRLSTFCSAS
ncbi:hypothetical protein D3C78_1057910 [compost metagenome]